MLRISLVAVTKEYIILASRVSKTRDPIKNRAFKTRFCGFSYDDVAKVFHLDSEFIKLAFQNRVL